MSQLPGPLMDVAGKAVLKAVDQAVEHRWERAVRLANRQPGSTPEAKVRGISKAFNRELAGVGAATGAVAAAPGLGTAAAAGALVADLGWFAMRTTDLIMTIGAAYGHTESTVEERRAWVLAILAFGGEAASEFASLLADVPSKVPYDDVLGAAGNSSSDNLRYGDVSGTTGNSSSDNLRYGDVSGTTGNSSSDNLRYGDVLGAARNSGSNVVRYGDVLGAARNSGSNVVRYAGTDAVTLDALRRLNANMASRVLSRYSTRRGIQSVGKLLPLGVGAVVGGTANYAMIRASRKQATKFFQSYGKQAPQTQTSQLLPPMPSDRHLIAGNSIPPKPEHRPD